MSTNLVPTTIIRANSAEDTVKERILAKYFAASDLLQKIINEKQSVGPSGKPGAATSWPEFAAAVLAEYWLIRPKLEYVKKITRDEETQKRLDGLKDLDRVRLATTDSLYQVNAANKVVFNAELVYSLVDAHQVIAEFLELDGVTKFEREHLPLGAALLQRRSS